MSDLLKLIKEEIENQYKILKFEDEREIDNGFLIIFTNDCSNILGEYIEQILNWKEELEDEFEIELEFEIDSENKRLIFNLSGE